MGAHSDILGQARLHVPPCESRATNPDFTVRHFYCSTYDVVYAFAQMRYAILRIKLCVTDLCSAGVNTIASRTNR